MSARSATALRLEIEHALERSFPAALTPAQRTIRETASTGIAEVDVLLDGGLPVGAISEVNGPESSGRTTLVLSFLAQRTAAAQVCAWVDADDAFDPESAAANGVNLRQLLVGALPEGQRARQSKQAAKPWTRLDQALRATDLLLQAGGFAAIVLDLGDTAAEHAPPDSTGDVVPFSPGGGPRADAAWWCWAGGVMRSRARPWCWSARRCSRCNCRRNSAAWLQLSGAK